MKFKWKDGELDFVGTEMLGAGHFRGDRVDPSRQIELTVEEHHVVRDDRHGDGRPGKLTKASGATPPPALTHPSEHRGQP